MCVKVLCGIKVSMPLLFSLYNDDNPLSIGKHLNIYSAIICRFYAASETHKGIKMVEIGFGH